MYKAQQITECILVLRGTISNYIVKAMKTSRGNLITTIGVTAKMHPIHFMKLSALERKFNHGNHVNLKYKNKACFPDPNPKREVNFKKKKKPHSNCDLFFPMPTNIESGHKITRHTQFILYSFQLLDCMHAVSTALKNFTHMSPVFIS